MTGKLTGKTVAIIVADEFEDVELLYPVLRLSEEGADIIVTQPGTDYRVIYGRRDHPSQLVARKAPIGPIDFRVQAWILANDTARELGWI